MNTVYEAAHGPEDGDFERVPGLFRRWDIEHVLEPGSDLQVEQAGEAADGTALFTVYRRRTAVPKNAIPTSRRPARSRALR
jgi:hypothetical protein